MTCVGIDLHKESPVEAMDNDGNVLFNERIQNTHDDTRYALSTPPKNSKYVAESSSVCMVHSGLCEMNRVLTRFYPIRTIQRHVAAASQKKTDKIDAHILADLLRGE